MHIKQPYHILSFTNH